MKPDELKTHALTHALTQAERKLTTLQTQITVAHTILTALNLDEQDEERVAKLHSDYVSQYETAYREYSELSGERRTEIESLFTSLPAKMREIAKQARGEMAEADKATIIRNMIPRVYAGEITLREGFFSKEGVAYAHLPKAIANAEPWPGQDLFLKALAYVERKQDSDVYKGMETCRCCGMQNGNSEFTYTRFGTTFNWPNGFAHYIEAHNVRPSLAFQDWVMAQYGLSKKKTVKKTKKTKTTYRSKPMKGN